MGAGDSHGRITSGIDRNTGPRQTLRFIETHLAAWRDDPERVEVEPERELNSQLCKFLNTQARRSDFSMVQFHHEEYQGRRHAIDLSAGLSEGGVIEGRQFTKYDPILVVECKRLPTPGSRRRKEYVSSESGEKPGGGIQRFKLGLHGREHRIAGMVGYVQKKTCGQWLHEVNRWIDELSSSPDPIWSAGDRLNLRSHDPDSRVMRFESEHVREGGVSQTVWLIHLWIEMPEATARNTL